MEDHDEDATYAITRFYFKGGNKTIKTGLTLAEAQEHCRDPESSSRTATSPDEPGVWFDGFDKE